MEEKSIKKSSTNIATTNAISNNNNNLNLNNNILPEETKV